MKNLSVFGAVFSELKKCWYFEFWWIKYFGNDFWFLITYMVLLLLKLRAVGLDFKLVYILEKTVQDMFLDSYFRQIASSQVTSFWFFFDVIFFIILLFFILFILFILLFILLLFFYIIILLFFIIFYFFYYFWCYFDVIFDVIFLMLFFDVIFEINRHLFLVYLLLTLNIVFFG